MLNIFKKKQTEQELIAEIHHEFDSAEDKLLKQATDLLATLTVTAESDIEQLATRLEKVGFKNAPAVQKATDLRTKRILEKQKIVTTQKQAELIKYYKQNYPFQKFITQDELDRICQKYKLNYAPIHTYIKDVPEKNLKEIEQAKALLKGDSIIMSMYVSVNEFGSGCPDNVKKMLRHKILLESSEGRFGLEDRDIGGYITQYLKDVYNYDFEYRWDTVNFRSFCIEEANKTDLFIAAPPEHFNLAGLKKEGEFGYVDTKKSIIKNDPIVFRYVRGGIQVISKWGLEASEDALVNEINN